jgi:hypothetical protein
MIVFSKRCCATSGCLAAAGSWAVWGCLDFHVQNRAYCHPCCNSQRSKAYLGMLTCPCGLGVADFLFRDIGGDVTFDVTRRFI